MLYIIAAVCAAAAAYIIYKISPALFCIILNFISNIIISFAGLTLYNIAAGYFGIYAGINIFSVLLCAIGGIPAFISIVLLAAFFA